MTATIEIPKAKDGEDLVYSEPINAVNLAKMQRVNSMKTPDHTQTKWGFTAAKRTNK